MSLITYKLKAKLLRYINSYRKRLRLEAQLLDKLERIAVSDRDGRYTKKQLEGIKACVQLKKKYKL